MRKLFEQVFSVHGLVSRCKPEFAFLKEMLTVTWHAVCNV
ncbi:MAG: hypothetical protein GQF41_0076 [Candidatus Rifleibacterium amylolyticum]|nr:MAG: hypothetical protein GQF41_0076 [Candidatus Rifleibacterium amylolyticum]